MLRIIWISFLQLYLLKTATSQVPIPTPAQLAWAGAEFRVIFHYDLHVFDGQPYNQVKKQDHPSC